MVTVCVGAGYRRLFLQRKMVEPKHEPQFQNEAVPCSNFAIRRQGTLYNSKHWLR